MVVTQFSEDEWNKIISPAARAAINSARMVRNMPHAIFYGPEKYQGLNVHNPYFLQGITHIMVLIQESVLQSQNVILLKACTEAFRVEIGIPFSLTNTKYDRRRFAYYVPNCWYKTLWKFMSLPEFDSCLEIVEDFEDPPLLRQRDVYLMSVFETNGYKREELKSLNVVQKYLCAFTLTDIATIDGKKISHQSIEGIDSNRLHEDIKWPRTPPALPAKFLRLWKAALTKCFLTSYSAIPNNRALQYTYQLGPWTSQIQWKWWKCQTENRLFKQTSNEWEVFTQYHGQRAFAPNPTIQDIPSNLSPISVLEGVYGQVSVDVLSEVLSVTLQQDHLSDFEYHSRWNSICDGFGFACLDQSILLNKFCIPSDDFKSIADSLSQGTTSVVSDESFCRDLQIGPSGTSAVIVAPETDCNQNLCATGTNWVTGPKGSQSSYQSKLAGLIAALTIIDVIVWAHSITEGSITIALDGESALEQSQSTAPLSADQKSFDYLQVIWRWIRLSPLTFKFRHVSGHQTDHVLYNKLDWWGEMNEKMDFNAKTYMNVCTTMAPVRVHSQPTLYLEKWSLTLDGNKLMCIN